jgi:osmotically-inducible protein OsmY
MTRNTEKMLNADLHRRILEELEVDAAVDAGKIGIAVESGVVTLTGTVSSFNEKWAAEKAVKGVRGVRSLASELNIELLGMHRMNDTDIAATIASALSWDRALPTSIQVEAEQGVVELSGIVEWTFQRELAADLVRCVAGVLAIQNHIRVRNASLSQ